MSARCKRCGFPIARGRLSDVIAEVTALLDLEVPRPSWMSQPWVAEDDARERSHLDRAARMGAAQGRAMDALAISHGFCSAFCAREDAREKTSATEQETA